MPRPRYDYALLVEWRNHVCRSSDGPATDTVGMLLECLRYMGPVDITPDVQTSAVVSNPDHWKAFYARPMGKVDGFLWAKMNRDRIRSFGIRAVVQVRQGSIGAWWDADLDGRPVIH